MNALVGASIYGRPGGKAPGQGPHGNPRKEAHAGHLCDYSSLRVGILILDIRPVMLLTEEERKAEGFP